MALFSIVYLSFALTLTFYHAQTIERPYRQERQEFHEGIIRGDFYAPYQYRIGATYLAEAGGRLVDRAYNLPVGSAYKAREYMYILERLIATWLLFIVFHLYLEKWLSSEMAFSGTLILAGLHTYTYHSYFYQPDSVINILVLAIGTYWIVNGETGRLYPLMFIGAFFRETSGLLIALYLAEHWRDRKAYRHIVGLFLAWLSVQILLRVVFGNRPFFPARPFDYQLYYLGWPVFLFSLFWLIPFIRLKSLPAFLTRGLLFMAPPLIVVNLIFGKVEETRLFLDLGLLLIPATMIVLFGMQIQPESERLARTE